MAALVFFNYSVVVRTVGGLWSRLDPRTAEAAKSLGASRARVWWTVTLPALAPAIAAAASLSFLFCATAFGTVLILGGQSWGTIETEIWYQTTQLLDPPRRRCRSCNWPWSRPACSSRTPPAPARSVP